MDYYRDSFFYKLMFFLTISVIGGGLFVLLMHLIAGNSAYASTVNDIQNSSSNSSTADPLNTFANDLHHGVDATGRAIRSSTHSAAYAVVSGFRATGRGVSKGTYAVTTGVGHSVRFIGGVMFNSASFVTKGTGTTSGYMMHVPGKIFQNTNPAVLVKNTIRPADGMSVPTIIQMRAQQAQIIQTGTQEVTVAATANGSGGACDVGAGNGAYPLSWCNAPMDTIATVPFSSDHINRECTSYAYWYFSNVEGHSDLRVHGNAKYWAATSNYPLHAEPIVGAMAVETAGAYGHVAIVQALPGQQFEGQVVPAGYILVSEMNYDWAGHFRYSYSPLGKFQAFIYR